MTLAKVPSPARALLARGANTEGACPPARANSDEALLRECVRIGLAAIRSRFPRFSPEDAEDIVQELVVVYLETRDTVRVPEDWFSICAARRAKRFLLSRREAVPLRLEQPIAKTNWEAQFISRQLLLTMHEDSRKLLGRLFIAGFTVREIANAENHSQRSVRRHLAKSLNLLCARLDSNRIT